MCGSATTGGTCTVELILYMTQIIPENSGNLLGMKWQDMIYRVCWTMSWPRLDAVNCTTLATAWARPPSWPWTASTPGGRTRCRWPSCWRPWPTWTTWTVPSNSSRRPCLLYRSWLTDTFANIACRETALIRMCDNVAFMATGFNPAQLNRTLMSTIGNHIPAGTSAYTILHFAQGIATKSFGAYNWRNDARNMKHYNVTTPQTYKLR